MVFVKVRETYDLHTVQNKMTVISVHTPKPDIIKRNYPGLLMQCKAYRPVSCDVRIACASVLPLDPRGVGLTEDDVAPEDIFNPILYKAMSNKGMSQLEARINMLAGTADVSGNLADVDVDSAVGGADDFPIYYGLLAETNNWRHANPQSGLEMRDLRPLVYEMVYNIGDAKAAARSVSQANTEPGYPLPDSASKFEVTTVGILGKAKPFPFLNCTSYTFEVSKAVSGEALPGFLDMPPNAEQDVPYLPVVVAGICIPPSRLHTLYYRMVVEWTIEFSKIRSLSDLVTWGGLASQGNNSHFMNFAYSKTKEAITGTDETILDNDAAMVSSNVEVNKVM